MWICRLSCGRLSPDERRGATAFAHCGSKRDTPGRVPRFRQTGLELTKHMVGAADRKVARRFNIELFDNPIIDHH